MPGKVTRTTCLIILVTVVVSLMLLSSTAFAAQGLDEKAQRIKSEVLSIVKKLDQLEERLLYPSHTQMSVLISLREKQTFRLDSVDVEFDGKEVAHHVYSPTEVEALRLGGVQRIYTGNVTIGKHELKVKMRGKSASGKKIVIEKSLPVEKTIEPGIAELLLSEKTITLINR